MRADTFHKPGLKMHAKILHHLFTIVNTDVIKDPLWDTAALGPSAFPNNAAFVHQHVSQLLTTSFPNLRPQQVEVRVHVQRCCHVQVLLKPVHIGQAVSRECMRHGSLGLMCHSHCFWSDNCVSVCEAVAGHNFSRHCSQFQYFSTLVSKQNSSAGALASLLLS